jgi:uncharacterized protein YbjT (DUF2867 family)
MILVTGAAGKTGKAVMHALAARGEAIRAFTSLTQKVWLRPLIKDFYFGDLRDEAALREAAQGVRAIYHICPNMHPDEVTIGRNAIIAAKTAGVERFVYHSVLHPQAESMPHHWNKLRVEEMLFESSLPVTILQPTVYMQNILGSWLPITVRGAYPVPYPPETRLSLIDLENVGEAAAVVLTEPGHIGATYELCGTEGLTQTQIAEILSEETARPVQAEQVSLEVWEQRARAAGGVTDYGVKTLKAMFRYYEQFGLLGNPNVLRWLIRREPTSLASFLQREMQKRLPFSSRGSEHSNPDK